VSPVTYDDYNAFCGSLPATSHVVQWGGSHVWKVGTKVFAIGGWDDGTGPRFTFKVSEIAYEMLKGLLGLRPAPYFASRGMKWIQHHGEPGLSDGELKDYLRESHRIVSLGLTKKMQRTLGLNQN
jgi:predicted DNA-binding protein (MmcQ/YjbR family)